MKPKTTSIIGVCIAAIALCTPSAAPAKAKKSPTPEVSASPSPSASPMAKPSRPIPYRGKVASVDTTANTFTIGHRTIKMTDQTKITKQGAAATMADIVADETVSGSYWKKEDGSLEAKSVKLGSKSEKSTSNAQKKEAPEAPSPTASPSASP